MVQCTYPHSWVVGLVLQCLLFLQIYPPHLTCFLPLFPGHFTLCLSLAVLTQATNTGVKGLGVRQCACTWTNLFVGYRSNRKLICNITFIRNALKHWLACTWQACSVPPSTTCSIYYARGMHSSILVHASSPLTAHQDGQHVQECHICGMVMTKHDTNCCASCALPNVGRVQISIKKLLYRIIWAKIHCNHSNKSDQLCICSKACAVCVIVPNQQEFIIFWGGFDNVSCLEDFFMWRHRHARVVAWCLSG